MSASFFKRLTSSIIDFILVVLVVYLAFVVGGKTILRNRIDNFDEIYSTYTEIIDAYNNDLINLQTEHDANIKIANGNSDQEAAANADYNMKVDIVNQQNNIDIEPYNEPLTQYFMEIIYFFTFGFIILISILAIVTNGKTPGRKVMQVKLVSISNDGTDKNPNSIQVFFHDIFLKYLFIVIILAMSMYYGFIFIVVSLLIDLLLMSFTKDKSTIRDYFLKLKVVKAGYGY